MADLMSIYNKLLPYMKPNLAGPLGNVAEQLYDKLPSDWQRNIKDMSNAIPDTKFLEPLSLAAIPSIAFGNKALRNKMMSALGQLPSEEGSLLGARFPTTNESTLGIGPASKYFSAPKRATINMWSRTLDIDKDIPAQLASIPVSNYIHTNLPYMGDVPTQHILNQVLGRRTKLFDIILDTPRSQLKQTVLGATPRKYHGAVEDAFKEFTNVQTPKEYGNSASLLETLAQKILNQEGINTVISHSKRYPSQITRYGNDPYQFIRQLRSNELP